MDGGRGKVFRILDQAGDGLLNLPPRLPLQPPLPRLDQQGETSTHGIFPPPNHALAGRSYRGRRAETAQLVVDKESLLVGGRSHP